VILLRSAKFEIRHRSGASRLGGADLDDIACQAASDALLSIMRKVREFRGDSKFTTWAARFVVFEVKAKLRQHAATHTTLPLLPEHDDAGLAEADSSPDLQAEARDLANAALIVINTQFSTHQRTVFLTLLACDLSAAVVGVRMGLNANSVYQTVFRARQCLRSRLLAQGFLA
jgi:RNA polymerase sigma-70 factor (ECF subfamily)